MASCVHSSPCFGFQLGQTFSLEGFFESPTAGSCGHFTRRDAHLMKFMMNGLLDFNIHTPTP